MIEWILEQLRIGPASVEALIETRGGEAMAIGHTLGYLVIMGVIVKDGDLYKLPEP